MKLKTKILAEAGDAVPAMQANAPQDPNSVGGSDMQGGAMQPDPVGQQVSQAELVLIADRAQKLQGLIGAVGVDSVIQSEITSIANMISQLYNDMLQASGGMAPLPGQGGGNQVNVNPNMSEEVNESRQVTSSDTEQEHIIMQLRKSVTLAGNKTVAFGDGTKNKVDPKVAHAALKKLNQYKPIDREKVVKNIGHSHQNLLAFVNEDLKIELTPEQPVIQERVITASDHIITQLRNGLKGGNDKGREIEFENGEKVTVPAHIAKKIVEKFANLPAYEREKFQHEIRQSYGKLFRLAARG